MARRVAAVLIRCGMRSGPPGRTRNGHSFLGEVWALPAAVLPTTVMRGLSGRRGAFPHSADTSAALGSALNQADKTSPMQPPF